MSYVYFGAVEAKWNLERLLQEYTISDEIFLLSIFWI